MSVFGKYGFSHFLAHLFGWNCGMPISKYDARGRLWMAFQCGTCGKIEHPSPTDIFDQAKTGLAVVESPNTPRAE